MGKAEFEPWGVGGSQAGRILLVGAGICMERNSRGLGYAVTLRTGARACRLRTGRALKKRVLGFRHAPPHSSSTPESRWHGPQAPRCVCVCTGARAYVRGLCLCVCLCRGQRKTMSVCLRLVPLKEGFSLNPELRQQPSSPLLPHCGPGFQVSASALSFLHAVYQCEHRSSWLHSQ